MGDSDCDVSIDVEKLITLVQARPVLYDFTTKGHHNTDIINKCWQEIGVILNAPGNKCKLKWFNLRNSYSRYLRTTKRKTSGAAQKKKWYLAGAMSFLEKFSATTSNLGNEPGLASTSTKLSSPVSSVTNDEDYLDIKPEISLSISTDNFSEVNFSKNDVVPKKVLKKTSADILTAPMAEFLKAAVEQRSPGTLAADEDPMLTFFRSLLPEANSLSDRKKRQFKSVVLNTLNSLLDQQEDEVYNASRPASTASSGSTILPLPGQLQYSSEQFG